VKDIHLLLWLSQGLELIQISDYLKYVHLVMVLKIQLILACGKSMD